MKKIRSVKSVETILEGETEKGIGLLGKENNGN
jgi:hypothetical protein